jgi:hypothetical protein
MKRGLLLSGCCLFLACIFVGSILVASSTSYSDEIRGVTDSTITIGLICDQTGPIADITPQKATKG